MNNSAFHGGSMNNESFLKLLHLNFNERNIRMIGRFTQERQHFKENSSSNITLLHAVVKMELIESSDIIVETAFSIVDTEYLISNFAQIRKVCASAFMERAAEIEEIFLQNVDHLETESQDTEMANPYTPLADFEFMQLVEMNGKVSEAYQEHIKQHDRNLTNVKENRPLPKKLSLERSLITLSYYNYILYLFN